MKIYYKLFLSLLLLLPCSQPQALQQLDYIVAVVNEGVITNNELQSRIKEFERKIKAQGSTLPSSSVMRKQVLERMLLDSAQMQLAKLQGIHIDDISLNSMLESIARQNKRTLDDLRISLQAEGINFKDFREQTRRDITIRQLQKRMVYDRIRISEQEVDQFLDQQKQSGESANDKYHVAHILIATPEAASPDDIKTSFSKAEKAIELIENGESFRNAALKYSEGQQALNGGDLGWRSAAELPTLFLNAIKTLDKNSISAPLRSASGFHILKLIDRKSQQHIITQTHARHILIRSDEITTEEQVRTKITKLKVRLNNGEDFAKLAKEFSQDPGSKNNGGDLDWSAEGSFVPRFEKVMNSLKKDQISEPFRSQFGWHILQVLERRQQDDTEQLMHTKAKKAIKKRKAEEELQLWLRRIRDEAYVEYKADL
jgi:peptidyl-prolyl cis-trans isomerase SurA